MDLAVLGFDADGKLAEATERAGTAKFNATGKIPCTGTGPTDVYMRDFGVARAGGRKRALFFKEAQATGADLSQADGNMNFSATKEADLYLIRAGRERYEVVEAVVFGG